MTKKKTATAKPKRMYQVHVRYWNGGEHDPLHDKRNVEAIDVFAAAAAVEVMYRTRMQRVEVISVSEVKT